VLNDDRHYIAVYSVCVKFAMHNLIAGSVICDLQMIDHVLCLGLFIICACCIICLAWCLIGYHNQHKS